MALRSFGLLFLSTLVSSQTATIGNITQIGIPDKIIAGDFLTFNYLFEAAKAGQEVRTYFGIGHPC
jgi:hypothetical protein